MSYFSEMSYKTDMIRAVAYPNSRVPTGQGKVREICQGKVRKFCKMVREKSGNSVKWSGKLENHYKVREKSGNFKIVFVQTPQKLNKQI